MSYIKNSIPDDYSCSHFDDVETCLECNYSMQTSHLRKSYTPSLETWYNRKAKKTTKINKKTIKDNCPF